MIEQLLPPNVASAESRTDLESVETLFPEEFDAVSSAVAARQSEFATGRVLARRVCAAVGVHPQPILKGPRGEPRWPNGIVGSLTHCVGYRACVAARADQVIAVGIDAEPHLPLEPQILPRIGSPSEVGAIRELAEIAPTICWDRLLFCAKEATYKVWFPITGSWLGFEDARATLSPGGHFLIELRGRGLMTAAGSIRTLSGRWMVEDGLITTAIVLAS